jgi:ribosomal protein S18 acetylase RimI-like enzyme
MKIRPAIQSDYIWIAKLHMDSIPTGFLSKLGLTFLTELYRAIQQEKGSVVFVAETDGRVDGFLAGTTTINRLYKRVIIGKWYRFIFPLLKFVVNIKAAKMIIETFLYGFKTSTSETIKSIHAELLSIAVLESGRGKGVGKALLVNLENFFRSSGVPNYKVVTFSKDEQANCFYRSCQFILNRQFVHHGNTMNEYVKEVS